MENTVPGNKPNREKIWLIASLAFGVALLCLLLWSLIGGSQPQTQHVTTSDLINTKEIATLSVSKFVYNGIAQTFKENGDHDYNVFYKSTVKVSIDADNIDYVVDEEQKKVLFVFPEFTIEDPVIDVNAISIIPERSDLHPDTLIKLCRDDAYKEAKKSEKLISSARENLKSIIEAWYSPVFEDYTFEYQFGAAEGGEAK